MSWTPLIDFIAASIKAAPKIPAADPPKPVPKPVPVGDVITPPVSVPAVKKSARFDACLKLILEFEGGLDDDPRDPGGRTAYGILQREYNPYRRELGKPVQDVFKISQAEVADIYRRKYWDAMGCNDLAPGIDFTVVDYAINSGHAQCTRDTQRVLKLPVDGDFGPKTLAALKNADPKTFIPALYERRLNMLRSLHHWPVYGKGWTTRCVKGAKFAMKSAGG